MEGGREQKGETYVGRSHLSLCQFYGGLLAGKEYFK